MRLLSRIRDHFCFPLEVAKSRSGKSHNFSHRLAERSSTSSWATLPFLPDGRQTPEDAQGFSIDAHPLTLPDLVPNGLVVQENQGPTVTPPLLAGTGHAGRGEVEENRRTAPRLNTMSLPAPHDRVSTAISFKCPCQVSISQSKFLVLFRPQLVPRLRTPQLDWS